MVGETGCGSTMETRSRKLFAGDWREDGRGDWSLESLHNSAERICLIDKGIVDLTEASDEHCKNSMFSQQMSFGLTALPGS